MASLRKEIIINATPAYAWAALADWGGVHTRLAKGFVVDTKVDGEDRIVTFFNDDVVRERFVDRDDQARRLVWAVSDGQMGLEHYNGSAQVIDEGNGQTRFVWTTDLLPHEMAPAIGQLMERGIAAVKTTLEAGTSPVT